MNFSDSLIVFMSLDSTKGAEVPTQGIMGIFAAAALTFLGCLHIGHPIRGGIDVGLGFEPTPGEIYGPALSRAYALESKVAQYPRIVIGEELVRCIGEIENQCSNDAYSSATHMVASHCMKAIEYDKDGLPFIDYLGPYFKDLISKSANDATFVDMAYDKVIGFGNKYKDERNSQLAFRYTLLRSYFEDRMPLWADVPRR
jgi:hypothetical protein